MEILCYRFSLYFPSHSLNIYDSLVREPKKKGKESYLEIDFKEKLKISKNGELPP
jgi:hypothetical protein